MKCTARDVTIFFTGIAAWESLGHWIIGLFAKDMLPMKVFGFEFTEGINAIAMVIWPMLLIGLVYLAWLRAPRASGPSVADTHPTTHAGSNA